MSTGYTTRYLIHQYIKHLLTHTAAEHAALNIIPVRRKYIYIYIIYVMVVVFVIIVLARSSLWSKDRLQTTGRPTAKKKHILQEQMIHLGQEYRIFYNPENRVCESSCYEQSLSRWNCTCTLCAVHLFGGVELRNYERQFLMSIVAQRRCTAAFTQTLPSTTPSSTA